MTAIYNEIEPYAADWLVNLEQAGHIAPGRVERRSIIDLQPGDVTGPGQRHFFAGIGVWSHALRLAGWPDDLPVWTGSCPCQPFSQAGQGGGFGDARHLWPEWFRLIRECHPAVIFGEQVASKDGLAWLDLVRADLEGAGYAFGAGDLCAAGVGAPHIRQRLYFVAIRLGDTGGQGGGRYAGAVLSAQRKSNRERRITGCVADVAVATVTACDPGVDQPGVLGLVDTSRTRPQGGVPPQGCGVSAVDDSARRTWDPCHWVWCRDGKWRPVEPGTFPLAHGAAARVGRLRATGNAIVTEVAATFIEAVIDVLVGE